MSVWDEVPLTDVARLERGSEPGRANYTSQAEGVRFLRVGDITGKTDNPVFAQSDRLVMVTPADLVLTLDGTPGAVSQGHAGAISAGIRRVVITDEEAVSKDWLRFMLMSPSVQRTIRQHATGVTILHAASAVRHIKIPVPPMEEQRRLAAYLHEAEAILGMRRRAIRRTTEGARALFDQALATYAESEPVALDDLCGAVADCPHSTPKYADGVTEYPCLRSSDIQLGQIDLKSTKYVGEAEYTSRVKRMVPRPGDVVFCREGARLGNAAVIPEGLTPCLGQRMMILRPAEGIATSEFVSGVLHSNAVQRQIANRVTGAAAPHVNVRDVRALRVAAPPYDEQETLSRRVQEIRALEGVQVEQEKRLQGLFESLLQGAEAGEL